MGSSTIPSLICDYLAEAEVEIVSSLPDTWLDGIIMSIRGDQRFTHVQVTREESAIGVCSGAFFAGKGSLAVMGTSGFMASIYAITKINYTYEVGFPILMNLRGQVGDTAGHHISNGLLTIPILNTLGIPYEIIESAEKLARIPTLVRHSKMMKRPVAICLDREILR